MLNKKYYKILVPTTPRLSNPPQKNFSNLLSTDKCSDIVSFQTKNHRTTIYVNLVSAPAPLSPCLSSHMSPSQKSSPAPKPLLAFLTPFHPTSKIASRQSYILLTPSSVLGLSLFHFNFLLPH